MGTEWDKEVVGKVGPQKRVLCLAQVFLRCYKSGPGNWGRSACGTAHVARLEFPRETGHSNFFKYCVTHILVITS